LVVGAAAPTLLSFAGVRGQDTQVRIEAPPLALLGGSLERVSFFSADLDLAGRGHAGSLAATLDGLSLADRRFTDAQIVAGDITFTTADGYPFSMRSITGTGSSDALTVSATFDRADLLGLLALPGAERYSGGQATGLILGEAHFLLDTTAGSLAGMLSIVEGAVVFSPDQGAPRVVYTPVAAATWRLTGVQITPDGVTVHGLVDLSAILRSDAVAGKIFDDLVPR
jgi:hypothetical protein